MNSPTDRDRSLETLRGIFKKPPASEPTRDPATATTGIPVASSPPETAPSLQSPVRSAEIKPTGPSAEEREVQPSGAYGPEDASRAPISRRKRTGTPVSVYLSNRSISEVERIRRRLDVSFSAVVEEAIQQYLRKQGK